MDIDDILASLTPEQLAAYRRRCLEGRQREQHEAWTLINAGWTFELLGHGDGGETWQWRWRRPPKRAGGPGRKYPSTGQAYNALMRERGRDGGGEG